jgi:ribonuclease HII
MAPRHKFDRSLIPDRPNLLFEEKLWMEGLHGIAGVDEAGRGALAGPVAAGAVVLPWDCPDLMDRLAGVRDSKEMTADAREQWAVVIKGTAVAWGVGFSSAQEVDKLGIVPATRLAVRRALEELQGDVEHLLVDYLKLPEIETPQTALVKGDARSLSIAAASILAKTTRDAWMVALGEQFPEYGWARNKGYGTLAHREALAELGPCAEHRRSFAPVGESVRD